MKKNLVLVLLAAAILTVASCAKEDNNPGEGKVVAVDDGGKYTEKVVTINRNGEKTEKAVLRFYSNTDDIPYISIKEFHRVMLPKANMTVSRMGECYEVSTTGGTAMVDVKADQLTTTSIISIFDMISKIGQGIPCAVSYDGSPYVKPKERVLLPEKSTVTFNFSKYKIDLHDDGSNVYFPYATLADIYTDMNLHSTYYNNEAEELIVSGALDFNSFAKMDPQRTKRIYGKKEVSDNMAKYRYNELCFVFDYLYGYPGRKTGLIAAGLEQSGLDAALDNAQGGAEVKALLQSKDNAAFVLGMDGLQQLANDGGHTMVYQLSNIAQMADVKARYDDYAAKYPAVAALAGAFNAYLIKLQDNVKTLKDLRNKTYGDKTYIVSSDKSTAVIVINSFMDLDFEGWKTYYASDKKEADWETLLARKGNAVALLLSGIRQARKDGVKHVIIDVSQNTGGSTDIVMTILSLITKNEVERQQVSIYSDYVISKQGSKTNYIVDRNFDGKFDAEDAKVDNSDLDFAVLTSSRSFSCANLMPSVMKDSGFKVMGEQSGGGSCAIQFQLTPDGMRYVISCYRLRMTNAKGDNIDAGVPVDIAVPKEKFYDIDYLAGKF